MADKVVIEDFVEQIIKIDRLLEDEYGIPAPKRRLRPLDELILTILSQHTTDVNSHRAFESLRRRFPSWEGVMEAEPPEIAEAIRSGGLAQSKAIRIKLLLRKLWEEYGALDLDFLCGMELDKARGLLLNLGGVGPKTAACVLLFSCDKPAFPVDTHVHRVARRLDLIGARVTAEEAHRILEEVVPPDKTYRFHVNLIIHGRRICKAQRPRCEVCPLAQVCKGYQP